MRLYGSVTSPFVRRVRAVAQELGLPVELIDAFSEEGQRELRRLSPVWKVPAVEVDGRVLWDSDVILGALLDRHGFGPLRAPSEDGRYDELCFRAAVDEALGTLVKLFYLRRDGVDPGRVPYLVKDQERARSILEWVEHGLRRSDDGALWCTKEDGFGLAELTLYTALDWMLLRDMASFDALPKVRAFLGAHEGRASLIATAPPR